MRTCADSSSAHSSVRDVRAHPAIGCAAERAVPAPRATDAQCLRIRPLMLCPFATVTMYAGRLHSPIHPSICAGAKSWQGWHCMAHTLAGSSATAAAGLFCCLRAALAISKVRVRCIASVQSVRSIDSQTPIHTDICSSVGNAMENVHAPRARAGGRPALGIVRYTYSIYRAVEVHVPGSLYRPHAQRARHAEEAKEPYRLKSCRIERDPKQR